MHCAYKKISTLPFLQASTAGILRIYFFWKQSSQELEESFAQLRNATDEKVRMSQEQLQEAESYRERTAALIERTSQQLLLEESEKLFHNNYHTFCHN